MAEAMISGLLSGQVYSAESIWATDPVAQRRDRLKSQFGIRVGLSNREAVAWADVVVLAVKPQTIPAVLSELGPTLAHALVISIVAGVTIRTIAEQIAGATRVVRAMPNTPALVREGMTSLAMGAGVSDDDVVHFWLPSRYTRALLGQASTQAGDWRSGQRSHLLAFL